MSLPHIFFHAALALPLASSGFFVAPRGRANPRGPVARAMQKAGTSSSSSTPSEIQEAWDVDLYQNHHGFVWEYGSSLVDLLDPKPGEIVLDVGCGSGELTNEIRERGAVAIGIDADQGMVARAKENFPNTRFLWADVTELDPADLAIEEEGGVDAVFSNAALHWVNDAEIAAARMSRVLKPGGRFVAEFGGRGNICQIVDASLKVSPLRENPWYFPSVAEYSSILERNGIEILTATLFDRPTVLEDGEGGMKNWLEMFGGDLVGGHDSVERDELMDRIVELLRPTLYDPSNSSWRADYRRIRIIGVKEQ